MSKEFDEAVRRGGKVITRTLKNGKYMHLVKYKGKWIAGEIKQKQGEKK